MKQLADLKVRQLYLTPRSHGMPEQMSAATRGVNGQTPLPTHRRLAVTR